MRTGVPYEWLRTGHIGTTPDPGTEADTIGYPGDHLAEIHYLRPVPERELELVA
jgi:hypothetical protein